MAGRAARRSNARGVSSDWDRAAAVLLSELGVAAAHRSAISLVQDFHQLPCGGRLAFRSVFPVPLLCAVLCATGLGIFAEEGTWRDGAYACRESAIESGRLRYLGGP